MIGTNFNFNTLKTSGLPKNSLNFVFLGDGFKAGSDQAIFNAACLDKMNAILAQDPWKSKAYNLNFYSINIPSLVSGITHLHVAKDCPPVTTQATYSNASYFGLAFDSLNVHRFILPNTQQASAITATIIASMPGIATTTNINYNFVPVVICNDSNYGGSEWGQIAVTTLNAQSDEVLLHELGHCVGGLNDEYIGGAIENSWNTWTDSNPADVEWKSLLTSGAGIIQIGSESLWKGFANCKMNVLGQPYCLVCYNQIVKAINQLITLAGGVPATAPVNPPPSAPTGLNTGSSDTIVVVCSPTVGAISYSWQLGTNPAIVTTSSTVAFSALVAKTQYSVTVTVTTVNGTSAPSTPFNFVTP